MLFYMFDNFLFCYVSVCMDENIKGGIVLQDIKEGETAIIIFFCIRDTVGEYIYTAS